MSTAAAAMVGDGAALIRDARALFRAQLEAMHLPPDPDARDIPGPNALARMDTTALVGLALARCALTSAELATLFRATGQSVADVGRYSAEPATMPYTVALGLAEILELRNPPLAPIAEALRARLAAIIPEAVASFRATLDAQLPHRTEPRATDLCVAVVEWLTEGRGFGLMTLGMASQPPAVFARYLRLLCLRVVRSELAKDGVDVEALLSHADLEVYHAIT